MYYESHGQGEPIVLVYGLCCLINHWHHQISHFSKTNRVIAFDIRGHHKSDSPQDPSTLRTSQVSSDVLSLMDHLQIRSAHMMGHSFGVPTLVEFAAEHPDRVRTLALINGFAQNPIKGMFGLDVVEPVYRFIKQQYTAAPKMWDQIWKLAIHNPVTMILTAAAGGFNLKVTQFKDIEIYTRGVSQTPLKIFLPFFEDLMAFDGRQLLKKIHAPTLIIGGEKDAVTPVKFQEEMHSLIRGSEFVMVPYGSHCTQLDFPDYVNLKLDQLVHPL